MTVLFAIVPSSVPWAGAELLSHTRNHGAARAVSSRASLTCSGGTLLRRSCVWPGLSVRSAMYASHSAPDSAPTRPSAAASQQSSWGTSIRKIFDLPSEKSVGLSALEELLELDAEFDQLGFSIPSNNFEWTPTHISTIQKKYFKERVSVLTDDRAAAANWLGTVLWLIAPSRPPECCAMLSFQACCEALDRNFFLERRRVLRWIARPLASHEQATGQSFQQRCEHHGIDARELRERLIRNFEPSRLKRLR